MCSTCPRSRAGTRAGVHVIHGDAAIAEKLSDSEMGTFLDAYDHALGAAYPCVRTAVS